ncbi:acyltransferase family protein [Rossellomorea aquimaris]|uniref:acyltransferase family protein n=1 Tax=Rossellomorea aquimaris TaxID=189382 RepID=UPI001CD8023E|nr:acyltransferase family protein [Rossellomorea aquimaris]MCA1055826.1 acyltransferase family protein [Rossellomorea aquimaris]
MDNRHVLRRDDLDWMKVIATLLVFLYHCSMFLNPFDWHVKNNELDSTLVLTFSLLVGGWIMPVFFIISGISSHYSLRKRSSLIYMKERAVRLGIPLLFGALILSPPQVYIERVSNHQFSGTFWAFLPHTFDGLYLEIGGSGNFAFFGLHLWYLLALILFSLITLPIFKRMGPLKIVNWKHIAALHLAIIIATLFISSVKLGGWDLVVYLLFFISGYYLFGSEGLQPFLKKAFPIHITLGVLGILIYAVWFHSGMPSQGTVQSALFMISLVIGSLNLVLSFFHLAHIQLSFGNRLLTYCSEASLPFYILHQPVIVIIGFWIKDLSWSIPVKGFFLVCMSFLTIWILYDLIVRRVAVLRFLFGLKGRKGTRPVSPSPEHGVQR